MSAGLEMLWWAGIRQGSVRDRLTGMWALALPGLASPDLITRLMSGGAEGLAR